MKKFKKLRKIYRIVFPFKYTQESLFENRIKNNPKVEVFKFIEDNVVVKTTHNIPLMIRSYMHSDIDVFEQIFNEEEYNIILKLILINFENENEIVIIDAGANVGYTSVYFKHFIKRAKIFSIEPSKENARFYRKNVFALNNYKDVKLYECALSSKSGINYSLTRDFRDGKDWAISTIESNKGEVKGITIDEIIADNNLTKITFLKIDIEGAERFIFTAENNLSFLSKTKILAIEIHDEFEIRESIYTLLKTNNYLLLESGELTIGLNKDYL
ncbi:MAG: FkbM family methyltransferase [Bizionia sp.]|nr:FkbM family methyltransferase [Bizionia sp.]